MKRRIIFLFLTLATIIYSCGKLDPCNGVTCANGGECKHGTCYCAVGFEGELCDVEVRSRYSGWYRGTLVKDDVMYADYILTVNNESVLATRERFGAVYGDFKLNTFFEIPEQQYDDQGVIAFVSGGQGFCDGQLLKLEYTYTKNGTTYTGSFDGYKTN